jgi:two-component system, sensor histidine kinase and response regulator
MVGFYDYRLVVLSFVIAMLSSYAAFDLGSRVNAARGGLQIAWTTGGAIAMGTGVWSMHYIGMLAFYLPIPVFYNVPIVAASLLAAILASGAALIMVSRERMGIIEVALGSLVMGSGIACMHYIGMSAMRIPAMCRYSSALVFLSIVLVVLISAVALGITFYFRKDNKTIWRKMLGAAIMGAAIPVMHYTGMAAVSFVPEGIAPDLSYTINVSPLGIAGIAAVAIMLLGLAMFASTANRLFSNQALALETSEQSFRQLVESVQAILWRRDMTTSQFTFVSQEAETLLGYPAQQWLDNPAFLEDHIHPNDRASAASRSATAIAENKSASNEYRVVAADGRIIWLKSVVRSVFLQEQAPELVGVMMDITRRKF